MRGGQRQGQYRLEYCCLEDPLGGIRLFKKVDHPGRARPVVFVLQAGRWAPALGLWPAVQQTPEWDPKARTITTGQARRMLEKMGFAPAQIEFLFRSPDGQRRTPRPA